MGEPSRVRAVPTRLHGKGLPDEGVPIPLDLTARYHSSVTLGGPSGFPREGADERVGRRLREIRKAKDFSQRVLGYASGVGRNTIYYTEKGEHSASVRTLERIADALGVDVREFFEEAES